MKIPIGNFGYQTPDLAPQGRQTPVRAFDTGNLSEVGEALGRVAGQRMAEEDRLQRQQEAEERARQEQANRTQAASAQAHAKNSLADLLDDIDAGLADGRYDKTKVSDLYTERSQKIIEDSVKGVPEEWQENVRALLVDDHGRGARGVRKIVDAKNKSDIGAGIYSYMEEMQRYAKRGEKEMAEAVSNVDTFVRAAGPQAGLNSEQIGKRLQAFKEGVASTFVVGEIIRNNDNPNGLRGLKERLKKDDFPDLDPGKSPGMLASIDSQLETLKRRAEIDADRKARKDAETWSAAVGVVQAGKSLSPEYAMDLQRQFKGTPYEKALDSVLSEAPANVAFAAQPVKQQELAMQALQAKGNDPKKGWTPNEQQQYAKWEQTHKQTLADIEKNPFVAAQERGVLREISPINITDIPTLGAQLAERKKQAETLRVWTGNEQSPLQPDEAKAVAGLIENMPPNQRASALGEIAKQVTPGQMRALSSQMNAKSPALGAAAFMAANGLQTTKGRGVAEIYLIGDDALKQGRVKMDLAKETGVKSKIYTELQGVYSTQQALDAAADAAYKVYAGLKSEGDDDVQRAIRLSTGGIMNHNGAKIPKPHGWTDAQVKKAVNSFKPEDIAAISGGKVIVGDKAMTPEEFAKSLPSARLGSSPLPDTYTVQFGPRIALTANGQPLYIPLKGR